MKLVNGWYRSDKGKIFVLTEKGKAEVASYKNKTVGKPVSEYDTEAVAWSVDEGYEIEVDDPDWVTLPGYRAVYDLHGDGEYIFDTCNHIVYHDRAIAEAVANDFNSKHWHKQRAFVIDAIYEGKRPKPCREYNGKKVYNMDYWSYSFPVGSLVEEGIVNNIIDCVPPACMRSDCMQCGEPASHKIDEKTGEGRETYTTFKKVDDGIYEYCGDCFRGENVQRGKDIPVVML